MTKPSGPTHSASVVLLRSVETAARQVLDPDGAAWFAKARQQIATNPMARMRLLPAVSRMCGREPLWPVHMELIGWTVDDAVRALLLVGASIEEVTAAYTYGASTEKRAVLRALPLLGLCDTAIPLVLDALHSNDPLLIAAAVGRYAAEHLPAHSWRLAVLICVTRSVPLAWVANLTNRADDELVRMLSGYARRRLAAGLPVPPDLQELLRVLHAPICLPSSDGAAGTTSGGITGES